MKTNRTISVIIIVNCLTSISFCQNTLHLLDTLIGEKAGDEFAIVEGVGDVNGDGYKDFVVSSIGGKYTKLYLGRKTFDTSAAYRFTTSQVIGIGDVNGDGYDDLLVAVGTWIDYGVYEDIKVYVCFGGKTLPFDSLLVFHKVYPQPCAVNLAALGDINGDGYADFAISNSYESDGIGRCYIYWGGKTISTNPVVVLTDGKVGGSFGATCGIGDINKDGYADFAISTRVNGAINMAIYYGGKQLDTISHGSIVGYGIANVGDVNGGGYNDLIIDGPTRLYLPPDSMIRIGGNGVGLGKGGDVNNDGYSDFIIGNENYINSQGMMVGAANIYFGEPIIDTVPKVLLTGEHQWDQFGYSGSVLGDINGDGYSEIAIGAPNYPDYNNPLGKVYIYSFAPITGVVNPTHNDLPMTPKLMQNYPNPFNPNTAISYQLSEKSHVYLRVYDLLGRVVATLTDGSKEAGTYTANFDASRLASGIYFVRFTAIPQDGSKPFNQTMKMQLMK